MLKRYSVYLSDIDCGYLDSAFRGRFYSYAKAILRCEEIMEFRFRYLAARVPVAGLSRDEFKGLLFVYFDVPFIIETTRRAEVLYSARPAYEGRIVDFMQKHRLPSFNHGDRVRVVHWRDQDWLNRSGSVVGGEYLDTSCYPLKPDLELIRVRFDFDGQTHRFPAGHLCSQRDDTNEAHDRERHQIISQIGESLMIGEPGRV